MFDGRYTVKLMTGSIFRNWLELNIVFYWSVWAQYRTTLHMAIAIREGVVALFQFFLKWLYVKAIVLIFEKSTQVRCTSSIWNVWNTFKVVIFEESKQLILIKRQLSMVKRIGPWNSLRRWNNPLRRKRVQSSISLSCANLGAAICLLK